MFNTTEKPTMKIGNVNGCGRKLAAFAGGVLLALGLSGSQAADWPQWRGPQRNGISVETGLLKEWPKPGPRLVWQVNDCASGYSTPAVVGDRLYFLGNDGLETEFVQARAVVDGKKLWSTPLGKVGNPEQKPSFPAARSTPTVNGPWLFALGSDGDLACLEVATGKIVWRKNLRTDFGGKPGTWAYAESPLIDGEVLVCTPGGSDATLVALNKTSGAVVWKCAVPEGDEAAYASAIAIETGGVRQYVQMLQKGLVGVAAKDGKVLWRYDKTVSRFNANIPSPVTDNGMIYSAGAGTGGGVVQVKANDGQVTTDPVYFSSKLPTAIGGAIKIGGYLYGTTGQSMLCADFRTGELKWEERAFGSASLCYADGHFYVHAESGDVGLVEATPDGYREKGRFTPPGLPKRSQEMEKAWAYPVVANGRLYVRDLATLWCWDVKATSTGR